LKDGSQLRFSIKLNRYQFKSCDGSETVNYKTVNYRGLFFDEHFVVGIDDFSKWFRHRRTVNDVDFYRQMSRPDGIAGLHLTADPL
jgi:deoxyribodipyrimidine photolyase-like uncharacterized protein